MSTKETITDKLRELQQTRNIRILYAAESGSRAWGIESVDSDYDIRFIYVRPPVNYLGNHPEPDTIELMDADLDFAGWDLRKVFQLLEKGNVTPLEWLASPMVYRKCSAELQTLADEFLQIRAIGHYYGLSKRIYFDNLKDHDTWPLKNALYVLRGVMAARDLVFQTLLGNREQLKLPTLNFQKLLDQTFTSAETNQAVIEHLDNRGLSYLSAFLPDDSAVRQTLSQWLDLKRAGGEALTVPADLQIEEQIEKGLLLAIDFAKAVSAHPASLLLRADQFIHDVILE